MISVINNIKLILSILASLLLVFAGDTIYLRDIFSGKIKPHVYTWLIWSITQGVALLGLLYGKGGWGGLALSISTLFVFIIFLVSLKYGTRNITKFDTITLIIALLAIIVWFQIHNPLLAVIMVSAIDFLGYIPSFRKTFYEPWTEAVFPWAIFFFANLFIIFSLSEYNLLTLTYLVTIETANLILIGICLTRREVVRPNLQVK